MKLRLLLNMRKDGLNYVDGHSAGDPLRPSNAGVLTVIGSSPIEAAEELFEKTNVGSMSGKDRSMSVGDVAEITMENYGEVRYFACQPCGWRELDAATGDAIPEMNRSADLAKS